MLCPSRSSPASRGRTVCRTTAGSCRRRSCRRARSGRSRASALRRSRRRCCRGRVFVDAELELRVGDDDAARLARIRRRVCRCAASGRAARAARSSPTIVHIRSKEMFSSWPVSSFVAGVKIGSRSLLAVVSPVSSSMPQTRAGLVVLLQSRADEVAARDAFDRHDAALLHDHAPPAQIGMRAHLGRERDPTPFRGDDSRCRRNGGTRTSTSASGSFPCPGCRARGRRRTRRCDRWRRRERSRRGRRRRALFRGGRVGRGRLVSRSAGMAREVYPDAPRGGTSGSPVSSRCRSLRTTLRLIDDASPARAASRFRRIPRAKSESILRPRVAGIPILKSTFALASSVGP